MKQLLGIEIVNFKNIENLSMKFDKGGNIWLITGDNRKGKSAVLEAILLALTGKTSIEELVTRGKDSGAINVLVEGEDGKYKVSYIFNDVDKPRLKLTLPNGVSTTKVTDLRAIFNYVDIDIESFLALSENAAGKKKQIEFVRQLLPEETQQKILKIEQKILLNEEGRKNKGKERDVEKALVDRSTVTEVDLMQYAEPIDTKKLQEEVDVLQSELDEIEAKKGRKEEIPNELSSIKRERETNDELKSEYDRQIEALEEKKRQLDENNEQLDTNIKKLEDEEKEIEIYLVREDLTTQQDFDEENAKLAKADEHNEKNKLVVAHKEQVANLEAKQSEWNKINDDIKSLREEKETLIKKAGLPVKDLTFDEDGLLYKGLRFRKDQISTSESIEVVIKLLMAMNKETKVFRVSRGESLGEDMKDSLAKFAKEHGFQGFVEMVKSGGELVVELYESKN